MNDAYDCECEPDLVLLTSQGNISLGWPYDINLLGGPLQYGDAHRINDFVNGEMDTQEVVIAYGQRNIVGMLIIIIFFAWRVRRSIWTWLYAHTAIPTFHDDRSLW